MTALLEQLQPRATRRRWWWSMAGFFALLGIVWSWWGIAEAGIDRCRGAERRLARVWSPADRQRVARAMQQDPTAHARQTWARVEPMLDQYAGRWAASYGRTCEATVSNGHEEARLDHRMACLERRRRAFEALVDVLAHPDAEVVSRAVTATGGLGDVDFCADEAYLGEQPAPPHDPSLRAQVEVFRARLARVEVLEKSGQYEMGLDLAREVALAVEDLDYAPLHVEAWYWQATLEDAMGAHEQARRGLERTYFAAKRIGHLRFARRAAVELIDVVGGALREPDEGRVWAKHALAEIQRGRHPGDEIDYHNNLGMILEEEDRLTEAAAHLEHAMAILDDGVEHDPVAVAMTLSSLGIVRRRQGRHEQALQLQQEALIFRTERLGLDHPGNAGILNNLGAALYSLKRYEQAEEALRRSLELREDQLGPSHSLIINSRVNLGAVLVTRGRWEEAEAIHRETLERLSAEPDARSFEEAVVLQGLGQVLQAQGRHEERARHLRRAVDLWSEHLGSEHPKLTVPMVELADAFAHLGEAGAAHELYRRTVAILDESSKHRNHPQLRRALLGLAESSVQRRDFLAVRGPAERLLALEHRPPLGARARFALGQALWELGYDRHQTLAMVHQAEQLTTDPEYGRRITAWLAERG